MKAKVQPARNGLPAYLFGGFAFVAALAYFLCGTSWTAFPGIPARMLLRNLEPDYSLAVFPFWSGLVRNLSRLPGLSPAGWAGLLSATCGAGSIALLVTLMMRTGYRLPDNSPAVYGNRESQARQISGWVAGLFLAGSIPFGVVATRSLPQSFHVLQFLLTAWIFSGYQQTGRLAWLAVAGVFYGWGLAENPTFLILLPAVVPLVLREMYLWRVLGSRKTHAACWGGLGLGLLAVPLHAAIFFWEGRSAGFAVTFLGALTQHIIDPLRLFARMRFIEGIYIVPLISAVPWLILFAMSNRSPWTYDGSKIGIRLLLVGGLWGVLGDALYAPWRLVGMWYPMVTPYLLLAVCMGYMAGEFWILGQTQMQDSGRLRRVLRRGSTLLAGLLPMAILATGAWNWRTIEGRSGGKLSAAVAAEILDNMAERDILVVAGVFADQLRLASRDRGGDVVTVSTTETASSAYLRQLAAHFVEEDLRQPLLHGDFKTFLDALLLSAEGVRRVGIVEAPAIFRPYGDLIPEGLLCHVEPSCTPEKLQAVVAAQRPYWKRMAAMARNPLPERSLARPFQDMIRQLASLLANNLALLQLEQDDQAGAWATLQTARDIFPENPSVLLNLLTLAREQHVAEATRLESDWLALQSRLGGERWALAGRYGYVWKAADWAAQGHVWVLSGTPVMPPLAPPVAGEETGRAQLVDQIYLRVGEPPGSEELFRVRLQNNGRDTEALLELCRLALRQDQPALAEAYLNEVVAMGLSPDQCRLEQILIDHARGNTARALDNLETLAEETSGDMRVWMALARLASPQSPLQSRAVKALGGLKPEHLGARLALADLHFFRRDWRAAKAELEAAIQLAPKNAGIWERMARTAQAAGDTQLAALSLDTLQKLDPRHPLNYRNAAFAKYQRGQLAEAEKLLREGLRWQRDAELLNGLAHVLMDRQGAEAEIRDIIDEAIRRKPGHVSYQCTRIEFNLEHGRLAEAGQELRRVLTADPANVSAMFLLARWLEARGDRAAASRVAHELVRRKADMSAEQIEQLEKLLVYLQRS